MLSAIAEIPNYWLWAFPMIVIGMLTMFLWNSGVTLVLFILARNDRRHEMSRSRIEQMATEIVNTKFQSVVNEVIAFKETISHLRGKVEDTEAQFDAVWDGERQMETKITQKLHDLKVETMKDFYTLIGTLATKSDIERARNDLREEFRK